MIIRFYFLLIVMMALAVHDSYGQRNLLLDSPRKFRALEFSTIQKGYRNHLAYRPMHEAFLEDSVFESYSVDKSIYYYRNWLRFMRHHLLEVKKEDYRLSADIIGELQFGNERFNNPGVAEDQNYVYTNSRGLYLSGEIGKRFSFQTGFYEVQREALSFRIVQVDTTGVYPGWSRVKPFKLNEYDYNMSFGNLSVLLTKSWMVELGYGKNHIGHGYRSLILSDATVNHPYLRSTLYLFDKRVLIGNTWGSLQTMERLPLGDTPESLFRRKGFTTHYLSWMPIKNFELGIFEGTIWRVADSTSTYALPWNYYVALPGTGFGVEGMDGVNNVFLGANVRYSLSRGVTFYGQWMADSFEPKSGGYQLGFKLYDPYIRGLFIQGEWNNQDLTGAPINRFQSVSHFNQLLGHPGGKKLQEVLLLAEYRYKRFIARAKGNYIDYNNGISPLTQMEFETGLQLNLKTDLEFLIGGGVRNAQNGAVWGMATLRTNLHKSYNDF